MKGKKLNDKWAWALALAVIMICLLTLAIKATPVNADEAVGFDKAGDFSIYDTVTSMGGVSQW